MIFRKNINQTSGLWVIFIYSVYSFINDIFFLDYLANKIENSDKVFLSLFTLAEFLLFSYYIRHIIDNKRFKIIITVTAAAFFFFLTTYFFTTKWRLFDSIPVGTEAIIIIIFSVYYLFEQINQPRVLFIYNTPGFWITFGFLIYLAGSFFIFIYASYVPYDEIRKFWFVTFILNTLKNIFFSIGILNARNSPTPKSKNGRYILS